MVRDYASLSFIRGVFLGAVIWGGAVSVSAAVENYETAPIFYSETEPSDAVSRLQARMATGEFQFIGSEEEILRSLLAELGVAEESQVLVFSCTSLQRHRISPQNPRAIYFSDDMYVGWVPGGLIEITSIDPQLGPIFYAVSPRALSSVDPSGILGRDVWPDVGGQRAVLRKCPKKSGAQKGFISPLQPIPRHAGGVGRSFGAAGK